MLDGHGGHMTTTRTGDRDHPRGASGATTTTGDRSSRPEHDPAVEVRGLRCSYGDFEAVRGIDLRAEPGELLAVLGTNGAGKTTTLEVLQGRRPADAGRVRVLGLDPADQRRALAARAGVVLQESALPDELTPAEFLRLWQQMAGNGQLTHRPVDAQLARVDLAHRRDVRIGQLSGGERRRLDLATALSADPELLFLDEPTAGLDPGSRADTWTLIRQLLHTGTTVVLTTHYLEEADALADRLAIMHQGQVVVAGSLADVLATRHARIRFTVDNDTALPAENLIGPATTTRQRDHQHVEVRTPDLVHDLRILLAWSQTNGIDLQRLHASEPTLAEVFHDVRNTTQEVTP